MMVNGKMIKQKKKKDIIIITEINMMVNGKMIKEKEFIILRVEINMMVNIKMIKKKGKELYIIKRKNI